MIVGLMETKDREQGYVILGEFFPLVKQAYTGLELQRMVSKARIPSLGINPLRWNIPLDSIRMGNSMARQSVIEDSEECLTNTRRHILISAEIPQLREALHHLNHISGISGLMAERDSIQGFITTLQWMLGNTASIDLETIIQDDQWSSLSQSIASTTDYLDSLTVRLVDRKSIQVVLQYCQGKAYQLTQQIDELNTSHRETISLSKVLLNHLGVPT